MPLPVSSAELARNAALAVMQTTGAGQTAGRGQLADDGVCGGLAQVTLGCRLMAMFCRVLSTDLATGDEGSRDTCSEFCSWVQVNYFDGITTDEHGAAVRALARQMNHAVDSLCATQNFVGWPAIAAEQTPDSPAATDGASGPVAVGTAAMQIQQIQAIRQGLVGGLWKCERCTFVHEEEEKQLLWCRICGEDRVGPHVDRERLQAAEDQAAAVAAVAAAAAAADAELANI